MHTSASASGERSAWRLPLAAALLGFALHVPFVLRYDLHFQTDFAISTLISQSIVEGEHPIFFWGQAYLGTCGNYLTAVLFALFGPSIPIAGAVSLGTWAAGVALTVRFAECVLGARAASWTALVAAVGSPYANHYITQPYTSYETAPALAILAFGALLWGDRLFARPVSWRTGLGWAGLGVLLGLAWWTTRLFLPAAAAVTLAAFLRGRWSAAALRRGAVPAACALAGFLLGAAPDLLYRLGYVEHATLAIVGSTTFELEVAPPAAIATNLEQGMRAARAYFNGDPIARHPEGITFLGMLVSGKQPYSDPALAPGALATAFDWIAAVAVFAIFLVAARTAVHAWRARNLPLLALCLTPFVHLAAIGLSQRTNGSYFEARRYWFGSLFVFALLAGHAMARAAASPWRAFRAGVRTLAVALLAFSLLAQARMLTLPDELGEVRGLVRELVAAGERSVLMPEGGSYLVAALSNATITAVGDDLRKPSMIERVARSERIAVVVQGTQGFGFPTFTLNGHRFVRAGPGRQVDEWRIQPYRASSPR